jgi:NTP pyrophosphatase (non-canonical NTP hydrolase)
MDIQSVVKTFDEIADRRGWRPLQTPRNLASAVALEAAELLQLFQWQTTDEIPDAQQRARIGEEAADVLMYVLALCARQHIDIETAVAAKIAANRSRFLPESL